MAKAEKVGGERSLPKAWRWVRFGDVVSNVNTTEADSEAAGLERYVGIDHLDPESLRITRWGVIEEGTTFTRKFEKGQVLFAKRRAYQRKAAIADFDGLCSGDLLVFETKGELLAELLPFVVTTDGFFSHALKTSAGSLSPRTKWTELAKYEFALPPKPEQHRILSLLKESEDLKEDWETASLRIEELLQSTVDEFFRSLEECKRVPLTALLEEARPLAYGILQPGSDELNGIPMIRTLDFDEFGSRTGTDIVRVSREVDATSKSTRLTGGELLISVMATIGRTFVVTHEMKGWNVNRALAVAAISRQSSAEFVQAYLQTSRVRACFERDKIGSAQPRLNLGYLRQLDVPLPELALQERLVERLRMLRSTRGNLLEHMRTHQRLARRLRDHILLQGVRNV